MDAAILHMLNYVSPFKVVIEDPLNLASLTVQS